MAYDFDLDEELLLEQELFKQEADDFNENFELEFNPNGLNRNNAPEETTITVETSGPSSEAPILNVNSNKVGKGIFQFCYLFC